jgi:transposase
MAKIGRPRTEVVITDSERTELKRLTKRAHVNRGIAFRARLVLAVADNTTDKAVARRLRTTKTTVAKWRVRFNARRLAGLYDEPRVGAPRTVSDDAVEAVVVKTLETTPKGETHWSTRTMAKAAGMSHTMVGRIWRTFGLQPHVTESFKLSPDPQLVAKVRVVEGQYTPPPHNAVVFSFDEKPQVQALQRAQPILPMDLGQPERQTHNYFRHGTLDLFAALNVATGEILTRCTPQHRAQDFVAFLRDIDASVETGVEIHVVLDNLSAHKAPAVHRWLLRHPRVHFHLDCSHRRRSSAGHTPASPSSGRRSWPTSRRITNGARPSSGSRPPTRFSTKCAASGSVCSRCTANNWTCPRNHRSRGLVLLCQISDFIPRLA